MQQKTRNMSYLPADLSEKWNKIKVNVNIKNKMLHVTVISSVCKYEKKNNNNKTTMKLKKKQ